MSQSGGLTVFHVGMPKCGSSALQTALSHSPELRAGGAPCARYVSISAGGDVLQGETLAERAVGSSTGYVISARAAQLAEFGPLQCRRIGADFAAMLKSGVRPLLSNEGWGNEYPAFADGRLLERLGLQVDILVYVRPQVAWCNSAWWQWGAWNKGGFARWFPKQLGRVQWGEVAQRWSEVPGVKSVRARLLPGDIVTDFCAWLGVDPPSATRVNTSLPASVLRLMQRHRELRKGPHDSGIEFAIGRHLRLDATPPPWVLGVREIESIIEATRASNEQLLDWLGDEDRRCMRDDPAWWSADFWSGRVAEPRRPLEADALQSDALAAAALEALNRLDTGYRELARRQRRLERELESRDSGAAAGSLMQRLFGKTPRE